MPTYSPQVMVTQPYPGKAYPSPGNVSSSTPHPPLVTCLLIHLRSSLSTHPQEMLTHPTKVIFSYLPSNLLTHPLKLTCLPTHPLQVMFTHPGNVYPSTSINIYLPTRKCLPIHVMLTHPSRGKTCPSILGNDYQPIIR